MAMVTERDAQKTIFKKEAEKFLNLKMYMTPQIKTISLSLRGKIFL